MTKKYNMNAKIRLSPFMLKYLTNSSNLKSPSDQNLRINTSNPTLKVTTDLLPDSVVDQKSIKPTSLSDLWNQHVADPLTN